MSASPVERLAPRGYLAACRIGELKARQPTVVPVGDRQVTLVKIGKEVSALSEACPHKMGPLGDGHLEGEMLVCPWHGWKFSVRTGKGANGSDVPCYDVMQEDGWIYVSKDPRTTYRDFEPQPAPIVEHTGLETSPSVRSRLVGAYYDGIRWLADQGGPVFTADSIHMGLYEGDDSEGDEDGAFARAQERLTERLLGSLRLAPGDRILDVGSGTGATALLAAAQGVRAVGITVSSAELARSRETARRARKSGEAQFHLAEAARLPFPRRSFDAALAIESLGHEGDQARALRELARVLRRGARLAIADVTFERSALRFLDRVPSFGLASFWSRDRWLEALSRAGFLPLEEQDLRDSFRRSAAYYQRAADRWAAGSPPMPLVSRGVATGARLFGRLAERLGYRRFLLERAG